MIIDVNNKVLELTKIYVTPMTTETSLTEIQKENLCKLITDLFCTLYNPAEMEADEGSLAVNFGIFLAEYDNNIKGLITMGRFHPEYQYNNDDESEESDGEYIDYDGVDDDGSDDSDYEFDWEDIDMDNIHRTCILCEKTDGDFVLRRNTDYLNFDCHYGQCAKKLLAEYYYSSKCSFLERDTVICKGCNKPIKDIVCVSKFYNSNYWRWCYHYDCSLKLENKLQHVVFNPIFSNKYIILKKTVEDAIRTMGERYYEEIYLK